MSALEQSLDAIISQNKPAKQAKRSFVKGKKPFVASKAAFVKGRRPVVSRPRGVGAGAAGAYLPRGARPTAPAASLRRQVVAPNAPHPAALQAASKVIVSGLPRDLKNDSIKVR